MLKIVRRSITIILTLPILCSAAEVVHVRNYGTHEPGDRGVLFGMAIAPNTDVLTLVAKGSGKWRLTRIRGWAEKSASDQSIDVPGWVVKKGAPDNPDFAMATLLVSGDGRYAICDAQAFWPNNGHRGGKFDDLVSVIDLDRFQVLKTVHTADFGPLAWSVALAPSGHLALQAWTSSPANYSRFVRVEMVFLSLPDLKAEGRCHFSKALQPDVISVTDEDCSALLPRVEGADRSLQSFLEHLDPNGLPRGKGLPCPTLGYTRDGQFELQACETSHRSAWSGARVTDSATDQIVARDSSKLVGTIDLATHNSVVSDLAEKDRRNYVLVMEGGTKLRVYEIRP